MKILSYPQVIHIKLWITFLFIFQKSLAIYIFMCYNIIKLRDNILKEEQRYDKGKKRISKKNFRSRNI